jgi:ABC-2 type transport system permease protein
MIKRTLTIMRKEFLHIVRDPRTLASMVLMPLMMLFLLGYAVTGDIEHISTAVLDHDRTSASRELISTYQASNYFDIVRYVENQAELGRLLDSGQVRAGLAIPAGYGRDLERGKEAQISIMIDGSDPNVANTAFAAAQSVGQAQSIKIMEKRTGVNLAEQPGLKVEPRVWYNPDMEGVNFMIPGLIGMILQQMATQLTAMAIVREKEMGTIEQLISTPVRSYELILGKVVPYAFISFGHIVMVLGAGVWLFKVPVHGSIPLLLVLSSFFVLTALGLGLFFSTVAKTQREAMLLTVFTLMPSMFLSGCFFPIEAMPTVLQHVSKVIPLTYALVIIRGIMMKGIGLEIVRGEVIVLSVFMAGILALAASRFRKKLE